MVLYDEFAAFCNETGKVMPEGINGDNDDDTNTLLFTQFLFGLLEERGDVPCTRYPLVTADINSTYTLLVRQWYQKKVKKEKDEVTLTFKWTKDERSKTFNITCPFREAMVLTDILGSTDDVRARLGKVRNWIQDKGKSTPNDTDTFAILDGDKTLYIQL